MINLTYNITEREVPHAPELSSIILTIFNNRKQLEQHTFLGDGEYTKDELVIQAKAKYEERKNSIRKYGL